MSRAAPDLFHSTSPALPFATVHEINERCLALLFNEARANRQPPVALVTPLRELLLQTDAATRRRAAQRPIVLADLRFEDEVYWRAVVQQPAQCRRLTSPWRGSFPRSSAAPLARALLVLAWHSLHADREATQVLLGMTATVAQLIESLPLGDIDSIASLQYRHLQPRWADQPAVWRELLEAAQRADQPAALARLDVRALQLITGRLLFRASPANPSRRIQATPTQRTGPKPSGSCTK